MKPYTKAKFLQNPKQKTSVFVRFLPLPEAGVRLTQSETPAALRSSSIPRMVTMIWWEIISLYFSFVMLSNSRIWFHAFKGSPDTNMPSASSAHNSFWDFISLTPESTHMITWLFLIAAHRKVIVCRKVSALILMFGLMPKEKR